MDTVQSVDRGCDGLVPSKYISGVRLHPSLLGGKEERYLVPQESDALPDMGGVPDSRPLPDRLQHAREVRLYLDSRGPQFTRPWEDRRWLTQNWFQVG